MTGQQRAAVLHVLVTLEQALHQVAGNGEQDGDHAHQHEAGRLRMLPDHGRPDRFAGGCFQATFFAPGRESNDVVPLAFMRGRTLNDAFIILDEAQNTTREQMKMFLTRMGFHSKTVITGDITQIDLPGGQVSGMVEALEILRGGKGFAFINFTHRDVVRHRLVQEVVDRYDRWESRRAAEES